MFFALSLTSFSIIFIAHLFNTKKWRHLIYFFLFVLILTPLLFYSLKARPYTLRGPESYYKETILFISMLAGMIANSIVTGIKDSKKDDKDSKKRKRSIFKINFLEMVRPLFVSPIIFLFVWGLLQRMEEFNLITCCFAFQNGFFWQEVLEKINKN